MKTNLIQSQLHRNAAQITFLTQHVHATRADAKAAQLAASRSFHRNELSHLRRTINRLADIQRELKRDMLAARFAKATVYKKHGKDDVRFTAWLEKHQAAERSGENYVAVEFFPPVVESISCGC